MCYTEIYRKWHIKCSNKTIIIFFFRFVKYKRGVFLEMGKKIARGFGIFVCVMLFVLCVFMLAVSVIFGSDGLVGAFGYNLYLCGHSDFEGLDSGAAVIVEQCEPYDLTEGNLILYTVSDNQDSPDNGEQILAYLEAYEMSDGVYTLTVSDADGVQSRISERALVGKAGWSSPALGVIISFIISPWGVCVMAVLPCLALILYSVLKSAADDDRSIPEVVPQLKNSQPEEKAPAAALGVKADGNAQYARTTAAKPSQTADSVLFTYNGARKSPAAMKPSAPEQSPKTAPAQSARTAPAAMKPSAPAQPTKSAPAVTKPAASLSADKATDKPKSDSAQQGAVPASVAARRYLDNAVGAQKKPASTAPKAVEAAAKVSGTTAELPQIPKKKKSDAFFAQSSAPQIGRPADPRSRAVIELEDALASAHDKKEQPKKNAEPTGKRTADIIAAKARGELISEDDDSRDRSRYEVDDILAGIDRRHKS